MVWGIWIRSLVRFWLMLSSRHVELIVFVIMFFLGGFFLDIVLQ